MRPCALDALVAIRHCQEGHMVAKEMPRRRLCLVKAMYWICLRTMTLSEGRDRTMFDMFDIYRTS